MSVKLMEAIKRIEMPDQRTDLDMPVQDAGEVRSILTVYKTIFFFSFRTRRGFMESRA